MTAHDAGDDGHRGRRDRRDRRLFKGRREREVEGPRDGQHDRRQGREDNGFPVHLPPSSCRRMGQHPGTPVVPAADRVCLVVEPSGNVPVTAHGGVADVAGAVSIVDRGVASDGTMGETNIVDASGRGLSPGVAEFGRPQRDAGAAGPQRRESRHRRAGAGRSRARTRRPSRPCHCHQTAEQRPETLALPQWNSPKYPSRPMAPG